MPQFVGVYGSAAGGARGRPLGNRRDGLAIIDRGGVSVSVSDSTLQNLILEQWVHHLTGEAAPQGEVAAVPSAVRVAAP
ncbi:hypothetical protein HYH03_005305 [Edaphochlamys debaryana]|uniref:Uncharacterized protein n=1 Tax=Edaphochlamys debaryana TaxID=47281 RepID=A0A836C2D5_9CHLO|nr:hypothetical protein HYH03_005305 [Edaphochlamys debaryana]|eukprot:KAG2496479.1 hypothetical protein HYH03_005305 [Edaphochlamys debaryana]